MKLCACLALLSISASVAFADSLDGCWIQPMNADSSLTDLRYWEGAHQVQNGGFVRFLNQSSAYKKTLSLKDAVTWRGIDFGTSCFTLTGQPLTLSGNGEITVSRGGAPILGCPVTIPEGSSFVKLGGGSLTLTNVLSGAGSLTFTAGTLTSKDATVFVGTPALTVKSGRVLWQPNVANGAALAVDGPAFTFGPDRVQFGVSRGKAASGVVTLASLSRDVEGGFLELVVTNDVTRLGSEEKVLVKDRASDGSYVDASVITRGAGKAGASLEFLTYDAEAGFKVASEAAFVAGQAADGKVAVISEDLTLSQDTAVSALRVENGATLTIASGVTLTVGDGVHPAGVVFRAKGLAKGTIKYVKGPGTLAFKSGADGIVYLDFSAKGDWGSWTDQPRLQLAENLKITGDRGVTFAGAAHVTSDYGTFVLTTSPIAWTGGTSILGVRIQGSLCKNLPSPLRVLGDYESGMGGQIRQNDATTYAQDMTLSGTGRMETDSAHDGVFCWGSNPYVKFTGRLTLAGDIMMHHDNKCDERFASLMALGGIDGPGGIRLNHGGTLELSAPCTYRGKTEICGYNTQYRVRGPGGTPGSGPVVNASIDSAPLRFTTCDGLVTSNDFTTVGAIILENSTNVTFLGSVSAASLTACEDAVVGCGTNGVNFGAFDSESRGTFTAAVPGGTLEIGKKGTDFAVAAALRDGKGGESFGVAKVTPDTVTIHSTPSNSVSGALTVREGTLRLENDPLVSPDVSYWLDASDDSTVETDEDGRVTIWRSKRGVAGVAFVVPPPEWNNTFKGPTVTNAAIAAKNALRFAYTDFPRLVATNTVTGAAKPSLTQRTVFIVTRPRNPGTAAGGSLGIYGTWGKDVGQRFCASGWNVNGYGDGTGATFDTCHGLRLDGLLRPTASEKWSGMYFYRMNEPQILTMRHEFDYDHRNEWGLFQTRAVFTPAIGGYWGGREEASGSRGYNGDIAEVIAFRRLLSEEEMQVVENYLGKKWGIALPHDADARVTTPVFGAELPLNVLAGATLDLNGTDMTVASLDGAGLITNSSATVARLVVNGANTFRGAIGGKIEFVEKGTGEGSAYAVRDGASLVVDGGTAATGTFADGLVTNGIVYWVDATRPETVICDEQGHVTNWVCRAGTVASFAEKVEKSGSCNITFTGADRYDANVTAFGGKPGVYFGGSTGTDGSNQLVTVSKTTTRTVFFVCACDGANAGQAGFWSSTASERGFVINEWSGDNWKLRQYTGTTYHRYGHLLHAIGADGSFRDYTWALNTSDWLVPKNFIIAAQNDETSDNFKDYKNYEFRIGRVYHRGVKAWYGEVIGYDRVLSEAEVRGVENYLYNKWFGGGPAVLPQSIGEGTAVSVKNGGTLDFGGQAARVSTLRAGDGTLANYSSLAVSEAVELELDEEGRVIPLDLCGDVTFGGEGMTIPLRIAGGATPAKSPTRQEAVRVVDGPVTGGLEKEPGLRRWNLGREGLVWSFWRLGFLMMLR